MEVSWQNLEFSNYIYIFSLFKSIIIEKYNNNIQQIFSLYSLKIWLMKSDYICWELTKK